jgi:hypothetical protein
MPRFLAYLNEQGLFYSLNHMFSALTGRRRAEDFAFFAQSFPAFETRNGALIAKANLLAEAAAERLGRTGLGGSDSHGVLSLGRVWTDVPGARNKEEFFAGLRSGRTRVAGRHGGVFAVSRELFTIAGNLFERNPWSIALAPLAALIPAAGLVNHGFEAAFEMAWRRKWLEVEAGLALEPNASIQPNQAASECVSQMEAAA